MADWGVKVDETMRKKSSVVIVRVVCCFHMPLYISRKGQEWIKDDVLGKQKETPPEISTLSYSSFTFLYSVSENNAFFTLYLLFVL